MSSLGNFVWSTTDQLRGVYKPHQYRGVILPFTILRRLDCILEPSRDAVRALAKAFQGGALDVGVRQKTGPGFYNTSQYDFAQLLAEPDQMRRSASTCPPGPFEEMRSVLCHTEPEGSMS